MPSAFTQAILFLAVLVAVATPSRAITCGNVVNYLVPCINYLTSGTGAPSSLCCTGASSLAASVITTADRQAACNCIKSVAKSITIKPELAKALPGNCGISMPFEISPNVDCSKIS